MILPSAPPTNHLIKHQPKKKIEIADRFSSQTVWLSSHVRLKEDWFSCTARSGTFSIVRRCRSCLSRICVLHFMLSFESRCTSCTTNEHMRAYVEICTRGYAESVQNHCTSPERTSPRILDLLIRPYYYYDRWWTTNSSLRPAVKLGRRYTNVV